MTAVVAAVALVGVGVPSAHAMGQDEKRCILAAGEKLPTVPGLVVTASRAEPAAGSPGKSKAYDVLIEYDALAQHFTTGFDCLVEGPGALVKMRGLAE